MGSSSLSLVGVEETRLVRSAASDPSTTFLSTGYSTATSAFYLTTTGTSAANGEVTIATTFAAGSLVVGAYTRPLVAQPEPVLSFKAPNVSHKQCFR